MVDKIVVDAFYSSVHSLRCCSAFDLHSTILWLLAVVSTEVVLVMSLYCNTASFVIKLWPVFFLKADNKRIGYDPTCSITEMGNCTCLICAREQQMESPYGSAFGFHLLLMLKNSKCPLFVGGYRMYGRIWRGSSISVYSRGQGNFLIPFWFEVYSELR